MAGIFPWIGRDRQPADPLAMGDCGSLRGSCDLGPLAARTVEINSSALETYDEDNPAIQNLRLLENRLSGLMPLEISLKADQPDLL